MNGAAMNCRQDPGLHSQHQDSSSLHNPGYHLQINRQQNLQQQNSKTLNYPSFSTNYQIDGFYDNLHQYEHTVDSRHSIRDVRDPRYQRPRAARSRTEPIDLPVPQFVIDEHSVSDIRKANNALVKGSKGLDLDTRIGLLIKSKALAGMHPIFSDLNDSEESESDLDDPLLSRPRTKYRKENKSIFSIQREIETPIRESFDDPEKPLSRPPSPFLSRATYLFWFNKAIEIKQQAKAQEQALLEQAAKRLIQDTASPMKTNQLDKPPQKTPIVKNLIDEISKELKEAIKQECIREVIELTAFNTLDDWWEEQNHEEKNVLENESEPVKSISNLINVNHEDSFSNNSESQRSTSPKMPFPWTKDLKRDKKFQGKESFKPENEKIFENETLRENNEDSCNNAHSFVPGDRSTISSNPITQEDQEKVIRENYEKIFNVTQFIAPRHIDTISSNLIIHEDQDKALRGNHEESFSDANSVPRDSDTISTNSITREYQESQPDESSEEDLQENCKVSYPKDYSLVKCCDHKIDNCACKLHKESVNFLNVDSLGHSTSASDIFIEKNEISQFLHSKANSSLDVKIDEKIIIVKDILDFILNNVNKIVVQRNEDEPSSKEVNKKLACQNDPDLTISMDSLVPENINLDSSQDFANVSNISL